MRALSGWPSFTFTVFAWGVSSLAACATYQDDTRTSAFGQEKGGAPPSDSAGAAGKTDAGSSPGGTGGQPAGGTAGGGAGGMIGVAGLGNGNDNGGTGGVGGQASTAGAAGAPETPDGGGGGDGGRGGGGGAGMNGGTAGSSDMGGGGAGGSSACALAVPSRATWSVSASATDAGEPEASAIDGNTATRWSTGAPQAGGEWFEVDFGATASVSEVVLDVASSTSDFPAKYAVRLSDAPHDGSSQILAMGAGSTGVMKIALPNHPTGRYLRLEQSGSSTAWWSIAELTASCNP